MKKFLAILLAIFLLTSCAQENNQTADFYSFIPENSGLLLLTPDLNNFLQETASIPLFNKNELFGNAAVQNQLTLLSDELDPGKSIVAFVPEGEDLHYLLISNDEFAVAQKDSLTGSNSGFADEEIKKHERENLLYFTAKKDGISLASNSGSILKKALSSGDGYYQQDEHLKLALTATDTAKNTLLVNYNYPRKNLFREITSPFRPIAEWSSLELKVEGQKISYNGIASSNPDSPHILRIFENLGVQKNDAAKITPASAFGFYSFTYQEFEELNQNLHSFRRDSVATPGIRLLNYTNEAGMIFTGREDVLFLKTTDPQLAMDSFASIPAEVKEFRGIKIFRNNEEEISFDFLQPLIPESSFNFFGFLDTFLVFTGTLQEMENMISHYSNRTNLENQQYYTEAVSSLAGASSLLIVTNTSQTSTFHKSSEEFNLEDYSIAAIQFVQENGFAHVHGVFSSSEKTETTAVQQISSIALDSKLGIRPFLVKNHENNEAEVLVQDENNLLYLFSKEGNLLWKKQMESRIIGEIHQVDLFKNGNLQFAFSTQNSLQVLDRTGKEVAPFPHNFKDNVTQPLAVFDYDNNKDYRLVVTQGNELLMYDRSGKIVRGFKFEGTSSPIVKAPKHIRTRSRDYILVPGENQKLNIISRQGKSRISLKEPVNFSGNEWYLNNGEFISVSDGGELIRIDEQGNIQRELISATGKSFLTANQQTLVLLTENILKLNDTEITLDYGLYTAPEIFEMEGKTYITLTDTQAGRVYIFNSNAQLMPGLPVYGNSPVDLGRDKEGLFFTVRGEGNNVLVYRL